MNIQAAQNLADKYRKSFSAAESALAGELDEALAIVRALDALRERVANRMMATAKVGELDACLRGKP